jgi:hypothetical protein
MVASALGGPALSAERDRIQRELRDVHQRFEGVRRFIEQGDGSAKVRQWLTGLEREETRLDAALAALEAEADRPPLRVHPRKVEAHLAHLRVTLVKGAPEPDRLCKKTSSGVFIRSALKPRSPSPERRLSPLAKGCWGV